MPRSLSILVVALLLALGLLWRSLAGAPGAGAGDVARPTAEQPSGGSMEEHASLAGELDLVEGRRANVEVRGSQASHEARSAAPEGARWVEGRVLLPPGVPDDEEVTILARGGPRPVVVTVRPDLRSLRPDSRSEYRSALEADGRFRVAFARGAQVGALELEARYLYLDGDVEIELDEEVGELLLEAHCGGVLRGRVSLPAELGGGAAELEGTAVSLAGPPSEGSVRRRATLAADGSFEFGQLPAGEDYRLLVVPEDYPRARRGSIAVWAGKVSEVEVGLTSGARISGHVVDRWGKTVARAEVCLVPAPGESLRAGGRRYGRGGGGWITATDASGAFEFVGVPACTLTLRVRSRKSLETLFEVGRVEIGERHDNLRVEVRAGGTLAGVVSWGDRSPAARALVRAQPVDAHGRRLATTRRYRAVTDERGAFLITGLGESLVAVIAEGIREPSAQDEEARESRLKSRITESATAGPVAPDAQDLQLVLARGLELRGSVHYSDGTPPERFEVSARPGFDDSGLTRSFSRTFQDANGEFELEGLAAGHWTISVGGLTSPEPRSQDVVVPLEGPLEFVIERGASLSGRVTTPAGDPVEMARIDARAIFPRPESRDPLRAYSNREGRFELEVLHSGEYRVNAGADRWAPAAEVRVVLAPDEERTDLVLVLAAPGRLTGRVLPGAGQVARRTIRVSGGDPWVRKGTLSEADGSFELVGLGAGRYSAELRPPAGARRDDAAPESDLELLAANSETLRFELQPGGSAYLEFGAALREPLRVYGTVSSGDSALDACLVKLRGRATQRRAAARTDERGRYSLEVDGPGAYELSLQPAGSRGDAEHLFFEVEVHGPTEQRVDLALGMASLALTLVDSAGTPAADAFASLEVLDPASPAHGRATRFIADLCGRVEFRFLQPGDYLLRAGAEPVSWRDDGLVLPLRELSIEAATHESFELRLDRGATLHGSASYGDGSPAAREPVRVLDPHGRRVSSSALRTDDAGRFTATSLPGGTLTVRVGPAPAEGEANVSLEPGGQAEVDVRVER